jgi:hypothetical protein
MWKGREVVRKKVCIERVEEGERYVYREWKREKGDSIGKLKREDERKGSKERDGEIREMPRDKKRRKRKERGGIREIVRDREKGEKNRKRKEIEI